MATAGSPGARAVRIGHSPDADDAFMFFGIARGLVCDPAFAVEEVVEDIESLNRRALLGDLDLTAISFHAYAHCADRYRLLTCGASMGVGYGPVVVARDRGPDRERRGVRAAVPGDLTSAALLLRLWAPGWKAEAIPFDRVLDRVSAGEFDAGVLIHEGQISYAEHGLAKVVDLGAWWTEETGLPVPLGGNAIRRDLPEVRARRLASLLRDSIRIGRERRGEALEFALPFARGLDPERTSRFVAMYVNDLTLDLGEAGREAVREFLRRGFRAGALPRQVEPEFLSPEPAGER